MQQGVCLVTNFPVVSQMPKWFLGLQGTLLEGL